MKLTQEQVEILANGKIEENRFYLQGQLDRKQYMSINEVLETIGLKWNRGKKAHIIEGVSEEELKDAVNDVIETGEVETLKETIKKFQFYPTPKEVAVRLIEIADIHDGDNVLEPSAGQGAIVDAILDRVTPNILDIVELKKENYEILQKLYSSMEDVSVCNIDFLDFKGLHDYSVIVANPPFAKSQDVKHILHMYELLKEGGILVSIASSSIKTREGKLYDELRALNPVFIELPEGSFKESGTLVNTVIVKIVK